MVRLPCYVGVFSSTVSRFPQSALARFTKSAGDPTIIHFIFKAVESNGLGTGHTPTGIALSILALIGALIALPFPVVSGVLMLLAGIGMFFVAGGLGALPFFVLAIAAVLVFLDRNKRAARA